MPRRAGDDDGVADPLWIGRRQLQHQHPAHRPADRRSQAAHAEMVEQRDLRRDHVGDGDDRELHCIGNARRRIDATRPGAARAAAQHVGADDEIARRIDRLARADHQRPPPRLAGARMHAGDVLVHGQRVGDEHRVRGVGVERAVGLVRHLDAAQHLPRRQRERRGQRNAAVEAEAGVGSAHWALRYAVPGDGASRAAPRPPSGPTAGRYDRDRDCR